MAYSVWQRFITDGGERVVTAALISVYLESSGAPATIYDGPSGSPIGSTTTSDITGKATFYAPAGVYKIVASKGTFSAEFRHVQLGNAQSRDVGPDPENLVTQENLSAATENLVDPTAQIDATVNGTVIIAAGTTALDFTGALSATKTIDCTDIIEAFPVPIYSVNGITAVTLSGAGLTFTGDLTTLAAGQSALLFRNGAAVHGNRLHIPPIESDITIAVPADYATLAEALDFVKSRVFLNGAKARIDVSAGTYTDQVVVDGIDLSHVSIFGPAVGAGTAVLDQTAWSHVGPWPGTRAYIQTANGGSLGPISGEWEGSILGYGSFVAANRSDIYLGAPDTAVDVTRFKSIVSLREAEAHVYSFTGSGTDYCLETTGACDVDFNIAGFAAAPEFINPANSSGVILRLTGDRFTGNLTIYGIASISSIEIIGNINVLGEVVAISAFDMTGRISTTGRVSGTIATISEPAGGHINFFETGGAGTINLDVNGVAPRASSTADYVVCGSNGNVAIDCASFGNVSTGRIASVVGAGVVQLNTVSAADFTGGVTVEPAATLRRVGMPPDIKTTTALTSTGGVIQTIDVAATENCYTYAQTETITSPFAFSNLPANATDFRIIYLRWDAHASNSYTRLASMGTANKTAGGRLSTTVTVGSEETLQLHVYGSGRVEVYPAGVFQ